MFACVSTRRRRAAGSQRGQRDVARADPVPQRSVRRRVDAGDLVEERVDLPRVVAAEREAVELVGAADFAAVAFEEARRRFLFGGEVEIAEIAAVADILVAAGRNSPTCRPTTRNRRPRRCRSPPSRLRCGRAVPVGAASGCRGCRSGCASAPRPDRARCPSRARGRASSRSRARHRSRRRNRRAPGASRSAPARCRGSRRGSSRRDESASSISRSRVEMERSFRVRHRWKRAPDGWLLPWICEWQFWHERPMTRALSIPPGCCAAAAVWPAL